MIGVSNTIVLDLDRLALYLKASAGTGKTDRRMQPAADPGSTTRAAPAPGSGCGSTPNAVKLSPFSVFVKANSGNSFRFVTRGAAKRKVTGHSDDRQDSASRLAHELVITRETIMHLENATPCRASTEWDASSRDS